jgi:hypothetical protein
VSSRSFSSLTKSFSKPADALLFGGGHAFLGKPSRFSQMFRIRHGADVLSHVQRLAKRALLMLV